MQIKSAVTFYLHTYAFFAFLILLFLTFAYLHILLLLVYKKSKEFPKIHVFIKNAQKNFKVILGSITVSSISEKYINL